MNILILGPVGSGKTTQARLLGDFLGVPLLNAGDLLFFASQEENEQAEKIKAAMQSGELVDSLVMHKLLEEHLNQPEHKNGTLLDGHPRTLSEAKELDKVWNVDRAIYIKISDEEAVKRLTARGRGDDTPEIIKRRLEIYHNETEPVLEHYRQKQILDEIDGERTIENICADIQSRFSI